MLLCCSDERDGAAARLQAGRERKVEEREAESWLFALRSACRRRRHRTEALLLFELLVEPAGKALAVACLDRRMHGSKHTEFRAAARVCSLWCASFELGQPSPLNWRQMSSGALLPAGILAGVAGAGHASSEVDEEFQSNVGRRSLSDRRIGHWQSARGTRPLEPILPRRSRPSGLTKARWGRHWWRASRGGSPSRRPRLLRPFGSLWLTGLCWVCVFRTSRLIKGDEGGDAPLAWRESAAAPPAPCLLCSRQIVVERLARLQTRAGQKGSDPD